MYDFNMSPIFNEVLFSGVHFSQQGWWNALHMTLKILCVLSHDYLANVVVVLSFLMLGKQYSIHQIESFCSISY